MRMPPRPPMNLPDVAVETPNGAFKFHIFGPNRLSAHCGKDTGWFRHDGAPYYVVGPFHKDVKGKPGWALDQSSIDFAVYTVQNEAAKDMVTDPAMTAVAVEALEQAFAAFLAKEPHFELKIAELQGKWAVRKAFENLQRAEKAVASAKAEIAHSRKKRIGFTKALRQATRPA